MRLSSDNISVVINDTNGEMLSISCPKDNNLTEYILPDMGGGTVEGFCYISGDSYIESYTIKKQFKSGFFCNT